MKDIYLAVKISEHVYWVGAIDWTIRDFHGYTTPHGSTYNAYLIMADEITLIDTVKGPFMEEMLSRIKSVVDPSKIKYIISINFSLSVSPVLVQDVFETFNSTI